MAMAKVFFSDLKTGRCSSVVEARLLRFWEARNVKRGGELMWMDLLMVDVNSTVMQVTISAGRLPQFREMLRAGTMFSVSGFDVSRCAQNFRLTDSSLMIRFNESTSFQELTEPDSTLPDEAFRFRNHSELIGLANTNTQLPDIIGEILSVKSTVCDPPEEKNRVMVTLKLDSDETVTLSFFDAQAVAFHKQLETMRVDPKVMVITSINPKIVGGRLFLNATSGTHVYFDKKTRAGDALFYKLVARDTGLPSAAPLLRSYAKVETLTIADLSSFIVSAESQEIDFLCTGKVVRVDTDKGWCYVACSKCSKKLQRTESAFTCGVCNNPHAVGALRYRVEMAISDDTAEGTFVWFDGALTKLHSIRASEAAQMLSEDGVNPEDTRLPPFIADMEGKTYTFQVRVTAFNFTEHHKTFTITRIAEDHGRLTVDGVGNDGDGGDDDDNLNIKTPPAADDQGGTGKARKKTDAGTSNMGARKEAKYLYGVLLMATGMINKGKKILSKLTDAIGLDSVERSWENVQASLSHLTVEMKDKTRKRDLDPGASDPRSNNERSLGAYGGTACDRASMGVSSTGTHNELTLLTDEFGYGDQMAIESRLARRARMAIRSSKRTQSSSIASTQPMKKRKVGRPMIISASPTPASVPSDAHPPDTPYAVSSRIARQLRLSIRRQKKTARLTASASETGTKGHKPCDKWDIVSCPSCGALLWNAEATGVQTNRDAKQFSLCCQRGRVRLPP
ncbi:hypothetical protein IGI04_035818, partial [Brassica rapa subsp. trilocularis]